MNELEFEFKGNKYKVEYSITRMPNEDHYFVFPKDKEIVDIVGTEYQMTIENKPGSFFKWGNTNGKIEGDIKLAITQAIREKDQN